MKKQQGQDGTKEGRGLWWVNRRELNASEGRSEEEFEDDMTGIGETSEKGKDGRRGSERT